MTVLQSRGSEYLVITSRKLTLTNLTTADSGVNISCAANGDLGTWDKGYLQLNIQGRVEEENGKYFIYACLAPPAFEKSNKNGEVVAKVIYDVLQKPECEYDKI